MKINDSTRDQWRGIWVIAEQYGGVIHPVSFELLGKAREFKKMMHMQEPVTALLLGSGTAEAASALGRYGAEKIIAVDHPDLALYENETYAVIIEELVRVQKPGIVLIGATSTGSDLAPTLGARLETGVAAHCANARVTDDGRLAALVPAFGGKVLGDILCPDYRPQIASFKPGVLTKSACGESKCQLIEYDPSEILAGKHKRVRALEFISEEPSGKPLEEAEVIVAGGFGIGSSQQWSLLEALAEMLDGAVGCTRPAVDEGWAHEYQMIGTSGKTVRPKVYLGAAISGAAHHICGMKDAELIISINKDEKASIFDASDLGVVGDASAILKILYEEMCKDKISDQ